MDVKKVKMNLKGSETGNILTKKYLSNSERGIFVESMKESRSSKAWDSVKLLTESVQSVKSFKHVLKNF